MLPFLIIYTIFASYPKKVEKNLCNIKKNSIFATAIYMNCTYYLLNFRSNYHLDIGKNEEQSHNHWSMRFSVDFCV